MGLEFSAKQRAAYWQRLAADCRDQLDNFRMTESARLCTEAELARYESAIAAIMEEETL